MDAAQGLLGQARDAGRDAGESMILLHLSRCILVEADRHDAIGSGIRRYFAIRRISDATWANAWLNCPAVGT
jgi:hypothetical protein